MLIIFVCIFLFAATPSYAGVNLPLQEEDRFTVSLELDNSTRTVIERDSRGRFAADSKVNKTLLSIAYAPFKKVPVAFYLKGGIVTLEIPEFNDFDSDFSSVVEAGAAYKIYSISGKHDVFLSANASFFKAEDTVITGAGDTGIEDEEIKWKEYLIGTGVEFDIKRKIKPFAGLRLSIVDGEDRLSESGKMEFETEERFGIFIGAKGRWGKSFEASAAYSLLDKKELSINLNLHF